MYITANSGDGTLSLVGSSGRSDIRLGGAPRDVVVDRARGIAFASDAASGLIRRWAIAPDVLLPPIICGVDPRGVALESKRRVLWVACRGGAEVVGLELEQGEEWARIQVPDGPRAVVLDESRGLLHVTCSEAGTVVSIDIAAAAIVRSRAVPRQPYGLAFASACDLILGTSLGDNTLFAIDSTGDRLVFVVDVGAHPTSVITHEDIAYVTAFDDDVVVAVNLRRAIIERRYHVGRGPFGLAYDHTRNTLLVTCHRDDALNVVDVDSKDALVSCAVGQGPHGVAVC